MGVLHPSIRAALDAAPPSPSYFTLKTGEVRAIVNTRLLSAPQLNSSVASVVERENLRIYTPIGVPPFPVLVFFHGGGWVCGSLDTHDGLCRTLANRAGAVVVSVDYRLAPESRFPAPVEDCYAALEWTAIHAGELGGDASRLAVAGDSAGGNLAAAVALMARDRGGPRLALQILIYPITDCNFETASYTENASGCGLTRDTMMYYWREYVAQSQDALTPYASPLRCADLAGLPSTLVLTAAYDPLRDDGLLYAARLEQAGIAVTCINYEDMNHGFLSVWPHLPSSTAAFAQIRSAVTRLGTPAP